MWVFFKNLSRSLIDLLLDFLKLAGDMGSVAIEDWSVLVADLTWMIEDDDLSGEVLCFFSWVLFTVTSNMSTTNILNGDVLDIETYIITWVSFGKVLVMHLYGLNFGRHTVGCESYYHAWLDYSCLNTSNWHGTNARDLVDVLEWESEWFVAWSDWWSNCIESSEECWSCVPWSVV